MCEDSPYTSCPPMIERQVSSCKSNVQDGTTLSKRSRRKLAGREASLVARPGVYTRFLGTLVGL